MLFSRKTGFFTENFPIFQEYLYNKVGYDLTEQPMIFSSIEQIVLKGFKNPNATSEGLLHHCEGSPQGPRLRLNDLPE